MFSIISIELSGLSFGGEVAAIGQLGMGAGPVSKDQVSELIVPWQPLQKDAGVFSLLSWHSRVSDFDGRGSEMAELEHWAESDLPVSVKFVIGDGGVGKSRLGAEFAEHMQSKRWSAGFVDLKNPRAFQMKKKGTMLVIDYPEEHTDKVRDLLHDLTTVGLTAKLRVLFLTRQTPERWDEVISLANARNIVDRNFMPLNRLDASSAKTIFDSTALRAGEQMKSVGEDELGPAPIPVEAMEEWLKLTPANDRALFIMAAAVHSAENPDDELVSYDSRQVILALVDREVERYMRVAEKNGYQDSFVYARLAAMAAIAGDLSLDSIKGMVNDPALGLGLENATYLGQELERAGLLIEGRIVPPKPDILAAAFVVEVFGRTPKQAPEIVWSAFAGDLEAGMDRLSRLAYDANVVLSIDSPTIQAWLSEAVNGNTSRSNQVLPVCSRTTWRFGWVEVSVAAGKTLLKDVQDDETRALLLNNLSTDLSNAGDKSAALAVIKKAVEIRRRLTEANSSAHEPGLAMSLNNLSVLLRVKGEHVEALSAIKESVEIRLRLSKSDPASFEPELAMSLNNLSNQLNAAGEQPSALSAINDAVVIARRLSKVSPADYEHYLSGFLVTLSNALSDSGDEPAALEAIKEAVDIRRRLAESYPSAFEPELANCLNSLSNRLSNKGDCVNALFVIKEAVEIHRRLAKANPAAFESDLAMSLYNLSVRLSEADDRSAALTASKEAVELYRRLAQANPHAFEPELAMSLNNLSFCLSDAGERVAALTAIKEAVDLYRLLAKANPAAYEPDLASSLGVYAELLLESAEPERGKELIREAVALVKPYAERFPNSQAADVLKGLQSILG